MNQQWKQRIDHHYTNRIHSNHSEVIKKMALQIITVSTIYPISTRKTYHSQGKRCQMATLAQMSVVTQRMLTAR
jgi:hypothetical protein